MQGGPYQARQGMEVPRFSCADALRATGELAVKHRNRGRSESPFQHQGFAAPLYPGSSDRLSSGRQGERKTLQFCRQVQRALNLALADGNADDGLNDLFVETVSPAPDCGHLLVHVVIPPNRTVGETLGALRRDAPRLRSEVAMAITRKRAPELSFMPAVPDGGGDE
jgi:ribosome-binding factor A